MDEKIILIATSTAGKVREMEQAFEGLPVRLVPLSCLHEVLPNAGEIEEPVEDGATFLENARIKAHYYREKTGLAALADDSGLSVRENILLPALLAGEETEAAARADELMECLGIRELGTVDPAELSGGELRRVTIARALVMRPEILLADEPTGDLDEETTRSVLSLLRAAADEGTAVLLVTHEPAAKDYADCCRRMDAGILTQSA